jgi:DNA-binding transcriptional LysR family regulator
MIRTEALRVFVTVAECGNIRDAADRLFRTQSAISMTLKQVEDHLGAPLFESDRKHSLTELGSYVAGVAKVLLRDHDTAIELIEQQAFGHSGRLRIASVPSVAALLIPEMLATFLADRPKAEIDLVDTDSADVRRLVVSGQADLGIASMGPTDAGLIVTPIFEDRMQLVCPANSPLAQAAGPLDWQDLDTVPLILNETTRSIQSAEFQAIAARTKLRVRNVTSLLAMVRAGIGVTLLPGLATVGLPPTLVARPLSDQSCRRQVRILRREGRMQSPLARAFQDHFTATIAKVTDQHGILSLLKDQTDPPPSRA